MGPRITRSLGSLICDLCNLPLSYIKFTYNFSSFQVIENTNTDAINCLLERESDQDVLGSDGRDENVEDSDCDSDADRSTDNNSAGNGSSSTGKDGAPSHNVLTGLVRSLEHHRVREELR